MMKKTDKGKIKIKENMALEFANQPPVVLTDGTGLSADYTKDEYLNFYRTNKPESISLRPGAAREIFELCVKYRQRLPSVCIDNNLNDDAYFEKTQKILFHGNTEASRYFREVDIKICCAMYQPWHRNFFDECAAGRLDLNSIIPKQLDFIELHGKGDDASCIFFAEDLIFIKGILEPLKNMEFDFFRSLKKCPHCGTVFYPKTARAVYCRSNCRAYAHEVKTGLVTRGSKRFGAEK